MITTRGVRFVEITLSNVIISAKWRHSLFERMVIHYITTFQSKFDDNLKGTYVRQQMVDVWWHRCQPTCLECIHRDYNLVGMDSKVIVILLHWFVHVSVSTDTWYWSMGHAKFLNWVLNSLNNISLHILISVDFQEMVFYYVIRIVVEPHVRRQWISTAN